MGESDSTSWPEYPRDEASRGSDLTTRRVLVIVAAVGLFGPALLAWSSISQIPLNGAVATAAFAAVLLFVVVAARADRLVALERAEVALLAVAVVLIGAWALAELRFFPAYGTDESAFVQRAAELVTHGHNPYGRNLLSALTEFRVPVSYATYTLNGSIVSTLGYPALSFLLVVPFVWLLHGVQAAIVANVTALAVETVLVFFLLPRRWRVVSVILSAGLPFLFNNAIGGVIVTLAGPFLVLGAYRWTETAREGRLSRRDVSRGVVLGLAAAISQFAWFVIPFVVVGVWRLRAREVGSSRAARLAGAFLGVSLATFAALNLPFLVVAPGAWLRGVSAPLLQHAIPLGQGLITAPVFFGVGGGDLALFTVAAALTLVGLLTLFAARAERWWRLAFVLPSVPFLLATRSLAEYFIMSVGMWVVSILAAGDGVPVGEPDSHGVVTRRVLAVGTGAIAAAVLTAVVALATPAPLDLRITSVTTNGQFRSIWQIHVVVTNRTGGPITPHFATDGSSYPTTFWNVTAGPRTLAAHQVAPYTLVAPNVGSMPSETQSFILQAVASRPESISSSAPFTSEPFECVITPSYVNHILPLGRATTLSVQLRSPYGAPVRRAGVTVALGQVIYAQDALIPAEARINGAPEGQTPVTARTDARGVAHFRVVDSSSQGGNPVYFQAYVAPSRGFPYGYSEVVSVQWGAR